MRIQETNINAQTEHDVQTPPVGMPGLLSLAAAPTFALMALLTGIPDGPAHRLCAEMQDISPLGGMAPMYLLMCIFHAGPWVKLVFG
jgi:hypothetical protein